MQRCWSKEKKESKVMEVLNGKIWLGWEAEDDLKENYLPLIWKVVDGWGWTSPSVRSQRPSQRTILKLRKMEKWRNMSGSQHLLSLLVSGRWWIIIWWRSYRTCLDFRYCYGLLLLSSFCHMCNYIYTSCVFSLVSWYHCLLLSLSFLITLHLIDVLLAWFHFWILLSSWQMLRDLAIALSSLPILLPSCSISRIQRIPLWRMQARTGRFSFFLVNKGWLTSFSWHAFP